uniref:Secreted protein n=1 Tax=Picea glauca TaxID=3330 RepID=A0A117NJ68_PICGL|nr:hypothetical protein ABT39_MTgene956 [Picea glauca]QHR86373.1 hypothetical protein Q903MT_gene372 [Picea sitchensis]
MLLPLLLMLARILLYKLLDLELRRSAPGSAFGSSPCTAYRYRFGTLFAHDSIDRLRLPLLLLAHGKAKNGGHRRTEAISILTWSYPSPRRSSTDRKGGQPPMGN